MGDVDTDSNDLLDTGVNVGSFKFGAVLEEVISDVASVSTGTMTISGVPLLTDSCKI